MNISVLINVIKTIFGKDIPGDEGKPWYYKRRYWSAAIILAGGWLYSRYAITVDDDTRQLILDNIQVIVYTVQALIAAVMVIYGTVLHIVGQVGAKKQLVPRVQTKEVVNGPGTGTGAGSEDAGDRGQPTVSPKDTGN